MRTRSLHGSWLTNDSNDGVFSLWGETSETRADVRASQHPFALSARDLRHALKELALSVGDVLKGGIKETSVLLRLPSIKDTPQPSLAILRDAQVASQAKLGLIDWRADALIFAPADALDLLASLLSDDELPHAIKIGADLRYWQVAARFALELLARQRLKPTLQKDDDQFVARWQPLFDEPSEQERLTRLVRAMPPICRATLAPHASAGVFRDEKDVKHNVLSPRDLLDDFLDTTVDAFARWHAVFDLPPFPSHRTIAQAWLTALCDRNPVVKESSATLSAFYEQYRGWAEPVGAVSGETFRICFRLDPPETPNEEGIVTPKANARDWSLRYFLQANDDPSLLISADAVWRERGSTLKYLNRKFDAPQERLLAGLGLASKMFPPIETSLRDARPEACALNVEQAYAFIREATLLLQSSGFGVLVPGISTKLGVRVNLKSKKQSPQQKGGVGSLTFESVIAYDWQLALGGEPLSRAEFERLAALKVPLVQVRGQWVEIRPDQIDQAIKFWEKQKGGGELSLQDALRLALSQEPTKANIGLPVVDVAAEGWIADLLNQLGRGEKLKPISAPDSFQGTLRHYQSAGLSWLAFLRQWGLGACLADDMGLGKCLSGDSLITINGAAQTAENIWNSYAGETSFDGEGFWAIPRELLWVNSLSEKTGQIVQAPIQRLYRQHIREKLRRIILEDGSHLTITRRHQLLKPTGWTTDFRVGDYVCVPAQLIWKGSPQDPDLVKLLAWQIAEGHEETQKASLSITQKNSQRLEDLSRIAHRVAQRYEININHPRIRLSHGTMPELRINSRAYRHLLEHNDYHWGKKSREKEIPPFIMQADRSSVRIFLQNYFDAEASVVHSMRSIEISSASQVLIQQLSILLRRFGIWMRLSSKRKCATNGRRIYRIYFIGVIGGNSARRFCNEIGFGDPNKQRRLAEICASVSNTNIEGIPASGIVADAVKNSGLPLRHFGMHNTVYVDGSQQFSRASLERVIRGMDRIPSGESEREYRKKKTSRWTEQTLEAYARLNSKLLRQTKQQLQELIDQQVFYCRIKKIEEIEYDGWVYDLMVSEHHNFVADNVLCHNTVQVAALLLAERAQRQATKPALVICPTSVVSNWERELARFAPGLRVHVHHGATRKKTELAQQAKQSDVILSSYALLHRDVEQLAQIGWGDVILDEAQNIKNPTTKQAQAARKIGANAEWRAALTGTPVENRLTELWSIFQFLNPDYLGSQNDFYNRFAKPIERTNDADATKRLKSLVSPFILRRVKTDPSVITDLPAKNEMKVFCNLTKEQATLYEAVVRDSLKRIEEAEGIERRGIVLATLMKLKQVCNHPAQFLGDGSALAGRSGKLARLTEMLEEVRGVRERALIFTQFAEMGTLLKAYLQETFGDEVLFLYGGTPMKARTKMIEHFQDDPNGPLVFILSIKAGGTGLNLMRANHVFHFDRWWNPAVENQATDRAFRIGQTKNVQVHKYLCAGTFEEKIDAMIERKKSLAESIVGTSEAWITEMTTEQLRNLLVLKVEDRD